MTAPHSVLPPPPPSPPAPWPSEWNPPWGQVELPPTRALALAALAVGVLVDTAIRAGTAGLAGALAFLAASATLLASRRVVQTEARILVALASVFGVCLALRTSLWLVPFDFIAACALLVVGASIGRRGSILDMTAVRLVAHAISVAAHAVLGVAFLRPLVGRRHGRARVWPAVVRGLLLGAPIVALLWLLLVNADAVFASFFHVDADVGQGVAHIVFIVSGAWALLATLRLASVAPPADVRLPPARLGGTEATVVASSVVVLFMLFAASQVLAATGAADRVLRTQGLTYAEYARSGFFQLLWVAGLTIAGLLCLRALTCHLDARPRRRITMLSLTIIALTVAIVGVAIHRMMLYEDAYGLTMLRLYVVVFAAWLGFALLLVGAWLLGVRHDRAWFPGVASMSLLGVLLVLNVINPEAVVARHNLTRPHSATPIDETYLADLSDDALPTIAQLLPRLDTSTRLRIIDAVGCTDQRQAGGWAAANLGTARADDARAKLCAGQA